MSAQISLIEYENGRKVNKIAYKEGKKNGVCEYYNKKGKVDSIAVYKDGERCKLKDSIKMLGIQVLSIQYLKGLAKQKDI